MILPDVADDDSQFRVNVVQGCAHRGGCPLSGLPRDGRVWAGKDEGRLCLSSLQVVQRAELLVQVIAVEVGVEGGTACVLDKFRCVLGAAPLPDLVA